MEDQGLEVEHYYPNSPRSARALHPARDALRAADNHCFTGRRPRRGVPARLWGAWPPSRFPTRPATALTCTSLVELGSEGSPAGGARSPTRRPQRLSMGYHFIGGLLAHLPAWSG